MKALKLFRILLIMTFVVGFLDANAAVPKRPYDPCFGRGHYLSALDQKIVLAPGMGRHPRVLLFNA